MEKAVILDASAIINGFEAYNLDIRAYTCDKVIEEVKSSSKESLNLAIDLDKINIQNPSSESVSKVKSQLDITNDQLSGTDIDLIALTLDLSQTYSVSIVTDDYGIQNIAKKLNLVFISIEEKGIKKVIEWKYYCSACFKEASKDQKECSICGSRIKRKPAN